MMPRSRMSAKIMATSRPPISMMASAASALSHSMVLFVLEQRRREGRGVPQSRDGCRRSCSPTQVPRPNGFDRNILALEIAGFFKTLAECAHTIDVRVRRYTAEETD